jgi:hypothetical protein
MDIPPMAWLILALGLMWLVLRWWQGKQAAHRAELRDARIAELLAERERMQSEQAPHSLGGVVSGPQSTVESPEPTAAPQAKEQRCLGCGTINAGDAKTCSGCGLEL